MQQYFSDIPLAVGQEYIFNKDQAHHAKNVVRYIMKRYDWFMMELGILRMPTAKEKTLWQWS